MKNAKHATRVQCATHRKPAAPAASSKLAAAVAVYLGEAAQADVLFPAIDKPLSPRTLKTYGNYLRRYSRHLGPEAMVDDFAISHLRAFILSLQNARLRPRTRKSAISALRAFGRWLQRTGRLPSNPADMLAIPKVDTAHREVCTEEMLEKTVAACGRIANPRRRALAKAMFHVMAFGLFRRAELLNIRVSDVNVTTRRITINLGKGNKNRTIAFKSELFAPIAEWLEIRGVCRHDYLWDYDRARRLHDVGFTNLHNEVVAIAGYLKEDERRALLPHGIRHRGARMLLEAGADIHSLKTMLGHSSIQTTEIYLETGMDRLAEVAELAGFIHEEQKSVRVEAKKKSEFRRAQWRRGG